MIADDVLGIPTDMLLINDFLVIADAAGEYRLHVYDASSGSYLTSMGRRGSGPGEFESAPYLSADSRSNTAFLAFGFAQSRITTFDATSIASMEKKPATDRLISDYLIYEATLLDDSTWVGLGFLDTGRLAVGHLGKKRFHVIGPTLASWVDLDESELVLQRFYKARLSIKPGSRDRIVAAQIWGSVIEIYRTDGELVAVGQSPFKFEPDFVLDNRGETPVYRGGWGRRNGFMDVAATPKCIYALFSGRSDEAFRSEGWLGEFVHAYTWEGEFRGAQRLDQSGLTLVVDEAAHRLLVSTFEPEPRVREYELTIGCDR